MSENESAKNPTIEAAPVDASITPPPPDLQPPVPVAVPGAVPPGWQPELGLPELSITQKPRWPHPNLGWSLLWCLLFMIVTQVPGAVIAVLVVVGLALLSPGTLPMETLSKPAELLKSEPMSVALAVAFFITELIVIGFSWFIIRMVVGRDWKRQLALRLPSLSHTLLALASLLPFVLLANVIYDVLRNILNVPSLASLGMDSMEEITKVFAKWPWGFAVLVIGLGPGIGEELWCRGFLGRGLIGNYGAVVGIIATSFFFGFIHLDPAQGTMAMIMGLWLHFVYLTTRSLLLPMLLHTLNNSLAVLDARVPQLAVLEVKALDLPIFVYASALLLIIGVAYALYQSRARLANKMPEQILSWRPAFESVEYPPADSGVRVAHPPLTPVAAALSAGAFLIFVVVFVRWAAQV
jgi:membrane protease YdiL (CAAX protease family)